MKTKKTITMTEVGLDSYVNLEYLFAIMQDAITAMFEKIGFSNFHMRHKHHAIWVFTKNKAVVLNRPFWNEEVIVNCRIVKTSMLVCYVKTEVLDKYKRLYFTGYTECCAINYETFKFIKQSDIKLKYKPEPFDVSYEFADYEMEKVKKVDIGMTLVDSSHHLNNARAILPVASSLTKEELENIYKKPFELAVKYSSQAMLGTTIELQMDRQVNKINFKYVDKDNKIVEIGYIKSI